MVVQDERSPRQTRFDALGVRADHADSLHSHHADSPIRANHGCQAVCCLRRILLYAFHALLESL